VNRLLREERGSVFVLSAFLIPIVFLVLFALIVDTGTWFTHKRQLQNRADSAALAAGVEYSTRWPACNSTPADKLAAANAIDTAARQYAGDPTQGTRYNTEVTDDGYSANGSRINVEINSNVANGLVDPDTSWNDPAGNGLGPCDAHPSSDRFSPANAIYVDVGVRERDQRTFMGMFGANLLRNEAHARVELEPAAAGKGFLPIALPQQNIQQAEIRYYRMCGSGAPFLLATVPLHTLSAPFQTGQSQGMTYWGPTVGNVDGADPTGAALNMPASSDCTGPYIPVSAEVRVAGVDPSIVNINTSTCAQLVAARFADCWSQVSTIRVFKDNPQTEPWFQEAELNPANPGACSPDAYFAKVDPAGTSCRFTGSIAVDWNIGGLLGKEVDLTMAGVALTPPNGLNGPANGNWTMPGTALNSATGQSSVTVSWCIHQHPGNCRNGDPTGGPLAVHALFKNDDSIAPVLDEVRTSGSPTPTSGPNAYKPDQPLAWFRAGNGQSLITVYPTVGLESSLYIGQRRVLRASGPQSNQSVDCEPATGGQGHDFQMFYTGCDPWYAENPMSGPPWWFPGNSPPPGTCPDKNGILAQPNNQGQPWLCVIKAPGFSPGVIGDGIASSIGNCSNINNNACSRYTCTNPNYYDTANPNRWALQGGEPSPRVVFLFIVPYGAYKNTGSQEGMPILDFAAFYVTGWHGNSGAAGQNPCEGNDPDGPNGPAVPDETANSGEITGYFVNWTFPNAPGNPHAVCIPNQLRPCVPVLVR
jgi:hypothetical protein